MCLRFAWRVRVRVRFSIWSLESLGFRTQCSPFLMKCCYSTVLLTVRVITYCFRNMTRSLITRGAVVRTMQVLSEVTSRGRDLELIGSSEEDDDGT